MTDYLNIKDYLKFRRGDIVRVSMKNYPAYDGIYQLKRVHRSSNFPYRVYLKSEGREQLLRKNEVFKVGRL